MNVYEQSKLKKDLRAKMFIYNSFFLITNKNKDRYVARGDCFRVSEKQHFDKETIIISLSKVKECILVRFIE